MTGSKKMDFTKPVDPKSRAWCSSDGCPWKHWGIWSHREANLHSGNEGHYVHLIIPDTEEQKQARRDDIARLDAEEEREARKAGFASVEEARAASAASLDHHIRALVITQDDALNGRPYRTLEQIKAQLESGEIT